jgi:hypothetical protein
MGLDRISPGIVSEREPRWSVDSGPFIAHSYTLCHTRLYRHPSVIELICRYNNIPDLAHVFLSFHPGTMSRRRTKEVEAVPCRDKGLQHQLRKVAKSHARACSGVRPVPNALFSHLSLYSFFTSCAPFLRSLRAATILNRRLDHFYLRHCNEPTCSLPISCRETRKFGVPPSAVCL